MRAQPFLLAGLTAALLAAPASAQMPNTTGEQWITMKGLNGAVVADYGASGSSGNVYVGPYGFQMGSPPGGPLWDFFCVDFSRRVNQNETYRAFFTNLGSGDLSRTYAGGGAAVAPTSAALQKYMMAAYLTQKFAQFRASGQATGANFGSVHAAIWRIMGQTNTFGVSASSGVFAAGTYPTGANTAGWQSYYNEALANWQTVDANQWAVVTAVDPLYGYRQEFMTQVTPEPTSMLLLGTGMAGMAWMRRRRRNETAASVDEDGGVA